MYPEIVDLAENIPAAGLRLTARFSETGARGEGGGYLEGVGIFRCGGGWRVWGKLDFF